MTRPHRTISPALIGIEIEATTKVSVRNIWLKKLN